MDEKSAIQALDLLDPVLPLSPGRPNATALNITGIGALAFRRSGDRHWKSHRPDCAAPYQRRVCRFLGGVVGSSTGWARVHIIADNLSAHKTKKVEQFLARHPQVRLHYTPTYSSWLNQIELWFSKLQRDVIARGIFKSRSTSKQKSCVICPLQQTASPQSLSQPPINHAKSRLKYTH